MSVERKAKHEDVLVVVGYVACEGGEADIGREWECDTVDGEAFGPFVPYEHPQSDMRMLAKTRD